MKAVANLIRPISYGVIVSACITITACTDETRKVPEGWREQIDKIVNLSERPIAEVSSFGNALRNNIVRETNQTEQLDILRRCCSATLKMPFDRQSARRYVYSLEVFTLLSESEYFTFWDISADREVAWDFLLKVLARCAEEVKIADSQLHELLLSQNTAVQTVRDQKTNWVAD